MRLSLSGARRWRRVAAGRAGIAGRVAQTARPATAPTALTNHIVARQSPKPAIRVPSGAPRAVALDNPAITTASARARRSGVTRAAAVAVAVGLYIAAPRPATRRLARTQPMLGASAVSALPATNTAIPASSRRLR